MKDCPTPMDCMDLRDYFAARAMPSLFIEGSFLFDEESFDEVAKYSYLMADCMMKARNK